MRGTLVAVFLTALGASCSADRPDTTTKVDAAVGSDLAAVALDPAIPTSTPNDTVAMRGTTDGAQVLVKGGPGSPVIQAVLPTGNFCADAMLMTSGPTTLTAFALKDGLVSAPTTILVTKDPAAPQPANATCLGTEMPTCTPEDPAAGNCSDGKDNDCDGFVDQCDPSCNGCMDDALEPNNDPFYVPMVAAGSYQLQICPCRSDWFAFTAVNSGDVIHVKITFNTANIDLDMLLQAPSDAEMGSTNHVAISAGTTNTEEINWTSTMAGTYYLKVYPYSGNNAPYTLTVY
jgi:hypothetical protein